MKAVLDRIEDNQAVILIEAIGEQFTMPVYDLPEGSKEGTWFHIEKCGETFRIIGIDEETTAEQTKKSIDLLDKLRAKSSESKYKRK